MKIIVTTTNKAKSRAAHIVFTEVMKEFEIITVKVDSGVANTPTDDVDGISGCFTRILNAKKLHTHADYYLGLEGVLNINTYGTFLCGWCVIEDANTNRVGIGCSARVQLPEFLVKGFSETEELKDHVIKHYPSQITSAMDSIGTNGIVTKKLYTRVDEYEDAIKCALGYLRNVANFVSC